MQRMPNPLTRVSFLPVQQKEEKRWSKSGWSHFPSISMQSLPNSHQTVSQWSIEQLWGMKMSYFEIYLLTQFFYRPLRNSLVWIRQRLQFVINDIAIHMTIWMIICKQTVSILRIWMSDVNSLMLLQTCLIWTFVAWDLFVKGHRCIIRRWR